MFLIPKIKLNYFIYSFFFINYPGVSWILNSMNICRAYFLANVRNVTANLTYIKSIYADDYLNESNNGKLTNLTLITSCPTKEKYLTYSI